MGLKRSGEATRRWRENQRYLLYALVGLAAVGALAIAAGMYREHTISFQAATATAQAIELTRSFFEMCESIPANLKYLTPLPYAAPIPTPIGCP